MFFLSFRSFTIKVQLPIFMKYNISIRSELPVHHCTITKCFSDGSNVISGTFTCLKQTVRQSKLFSTEYTLFFLKCVSGEGTIMGDEEGTSSSMEMRLTAELLQEDYFVSFDDVFPMSVTFPLFIKITQQHRFFFSLELSVVWNDVNVSWPEREII